ncbi:MAG TPA: hypothetical protein VHA07_14710 [Devosia sp.]|nr:hypothetical protein [Devosia sp.]
MIADEPANVQAAGAKTPANPEIEERRPSTAETAAAPASKTPSTAIRADNAGDADQTPAGMFEAGPANSPGLAWAGQIRGQFAPRFEHRASAETPVSAPPERAELAAAPTVASENEPDLFGADGATAPGEDDAAKDRLEPAGLDVTLLSSIAEQLLPTGSAASLNAAGPLDQSLLGESGKIGEGAASAATVAPDAMPADIEVVADMDATPSLDAIVSSRNEIDEDAAMRAIEGNWSRRDVPAPTDVPELPDVTAAVSAAQVAVEQVLARNGVEIASDSRAQAAFGKPRGLPAARGGQRDDLKLIEGLGPLDESTLNNLGIFHFDQVAGWSEREVLWLENHAFARGRIGREQWQAQARLLAGGSDASPRARR